MKRIASVFFVFSVICSTIFAAAPPIQTQPHAETAAGYTYIVPMIGAGGIPMKPSGNHYQEIHLSQNSKPWADKKVEVLGISEYTDEELVALCGVTNIPYNYAQDTTVTITASTDTDFTLVSQSNPSYRRPFELYLIPKVTTDAGSSLNPKEAYAEELVLRKGEASQSKTYSSISTNTGSKYRDYDIWFDVVLVLPGTWVGDSISYGGLNYPMTKADDYSTVVNLTISSESKGIKSGDVRISIPISGKYLDNYQRKTGSVISMYVHPSAAAGNLNLKDYGEQQVGEVKVSAVYNYTEGLFHSTRKTKSYGVFTSSSPDPTQAGDLFWLVRDGVGAGKDKTPFNSIAFEVILRDSRWSDRFVTSKGNEQIGTVSGSVEQLEKQYKFMAFPTETDFTVDRRSGIDESTQSFNYEGIVYVRIINNEGLMEAGRYSGNVYVHVVELQ